MKKLWNKIWYMLWVSSDAKDYVECNRLLWLITFGWWPRYLANRSTKKFMQSFKPIFTEPNFEWQLEYMASDGHFILYFRGTDFLKKEIVFGDGKVKM